MTDYWKSNERHYCQYCNQWTQGDKLSIRRHEQGNKHKGAVQTTLKKKRDAKTATEKEQQNLQKQLKQIEQAAQAKFAQDVSASGQPPPPPPPSRRPPPPPRQNSQPSHSYHQELEEDGPPAEDDSGVYMVRGRVYLDGKLHADKLGTGAACQIWVENGQVDDWIDALIDQKIVREVPNTDISLNRFTITYMLPGDTTPTTEREVSPDRLRLPMPPDVTLEQAEHMAVHGFPAPDEPPPVDVDETTGMGEWSTVSVQEIDESDEAVAKREAEEKAKQEAEEEERKRQDQADAQLDQQTDDAFGAYNPFGGTYKGVDIESSHQRREELRGFNTSGTVGFKKRKKEATSKKSKRVRREE